jgi:hypothetical protein
MRSDEIIGIGMANRRIMQSPRNISLRKTEMYAMIFSDGELDPWIANAPPSRREKGEKERLRQPAHGPLRRFAHNLRRESIFFIFWLATH